MWRIRSWTYAVRRWAITAIHRQWPSLHRYEWGWVFECGCCGFEGVACLGCESRILIGHVGTEGESIIESGDFVENGY